MLSHEHSTHIYECFSCRRLPCHRVSRRRPWAFRPPRYRYGGAKRGSHENAARADGEFRGGMVPIPAAIMKTMARCRPANTQPQGPDRGKPYRKSGPDNCHSPLMTYIGKMLKYTDLPKRRRCHKESDPGRDDNMFHLSVTDPETAWTCKKGAIEWRRRAGSFA